jgi:hypothetical protein
MKTLKTAGITPEMTQGAIEAILLALPRDRRMTLIRHMRSSAWFNARHQAVVEGRIS